MEAHLTKQIKRMNNFESGTHFWGLTDGQLAVFIYQENNFFICGGWEIPIPPQEITFVSLIEKPVGYENTMLYYS